MPNRVYTDLDKLRSDVNGLIDRRRVRIHHHAKLKHPEFTDVERIAVVRYGGRIRADQERARAEGVYLCWAILPSLGLCRTVFCIEERPLEGLVLIISVFRE